MVSDNPYLEVYIELDDYRNENVSAAELLAQPQTGRLLSISKRLMVALLRQATRFCTTRTFPRTIKVVFASFYETEFAQAKMCSEIPVPEEALTALAET